MSGAGHSNSNGNHNHGNHGVPLPWRQSGHSHINSHIHNRPSSSGSGSPSGIISGGHGHPNPSNRTIHSAVPSSVSLASNSSKQTNGSHGNKATSTTSSEYCETVVSMLSMLSCSNGASAQRALLTMTNSPESCGALRKANCLPLLIQILYPYPYPTVAAVAPNGYRSTSKDKESHTDIEDSYPSPETKARAYRALKNIVQFNQDDKGRKRETRILNLLESLRAYSDYLRSFAGADAGEENGTNGAGAENPAATSDIKHPIQSSQRLMQLSFDTEQKGTMCLLGAVYALAELITMDYLIHGIPSPTNPLKQCQDCLTIRLYSGMTLTNLTVGDGANKALLCSRAEFLKALVAQLDFQNLELTDSKMEDRVENFWQVTASVLRNLSWRASASSQSNLQNSSAVPKLMSTAIRAQKESTLRAALSALWNLSAYCTGNKEAICTTPQAIPFLINLLTSPDSPNLIVENAGGILRNVAVLLTTASSSAARTAAFDILRSETTLLPILLSHLKSSSLTIVANAAGILSHISSSNGNSGSTSVQRKLIDLGAIPKLKALVYSKHEQISKGATGALQNLMDFSTSLLQQPIPEAEPQPEPMDLSKNFDEQPLDLSIHSSKSTPIHVVSAAEFGTPRFLNPAPLQNGSNYRFQASWNSNSCPEFMRYGKGAPAAAAKIVIVPPAHQPRRTAPVATAPLPEAESDSTTNYSLHFTESEPLPSKTDDEVPKTYYCEGTPLNFSTANSMSDLTAIASTSGKPLHPIAENSASEDLPKKYCTESTPANFSRSSSLSSIDDEDEDHNHLESNFQEVQSGEMKAEFFEESTTTTAPISPAASASAQLIGKIPKPKRNVTFSANETPLMFSRASSVNSLDSVDVELNYGDAADGASVVSEFSRRASEVVSPSELPDSPRQICAPEPLPEVSQGLLPPATRATAEDGEADGDDDIKVFAKSGESAAVSGMHSVRSLSPLIVDGEPITVGTVEPHQTSDEIATEVPKPTTTTDETKTFFVEGTPFGGLSTATSSLSDLTFGDEHESETAPPLPPKKPMPLAIPTAPVPASEEPIYTDAQILQKCINAGKSAVAKLPKSQSEAVNINVSGSGSGKVMSKSTSCHETLELDPDLAALIQTGKNSRAKKPSPAPRTKVPPQPVTVAPVEVEANSEISAIEIPSISIGTAFRLAEAKMSGSELDSSSKCLTPSVQCKPEPKVDNSSSMISIDSLQTEMADLSIMSTQTVGESQSPDLSCLDSVDKESIRSACVLPADRFCTYTKSRVAGAANGSGNGSSSANSSPRQKRRNDPSRYLTRTISPAPVPDPNGNSSPLPTFSTFKSTVEPVPSPKTSRVTAATAAARSRESSPVGIRGRRKQLYSSLPAQAHKRAPTATPPVIPPKPAVFVRSTRTSELRSAKSRDNSRENSPKSSNSSLNSSSAAPPVNLAPIPIQQKSKKTPPKPPARSTTPQAHDFAVRSSSSTIGFLNDPCSGPVASLTSNHTLPRCVAHTKETPTETAQAQKKKESKFTHFLNYLKGARTDSVPTTTPPDPKPQKFSFNFGRRKSTPSAPAPHNESATSVWVKRSNAHLRSGTTGASTVVSVAPFNYPAASPPDRSQTPTTKKSEPLNHSKKNCTKVTTTV